MKAGLVIPNLNGRQILAAALETLERQTQRADVVVVDNASDDGAAEMVAERFPWVRLVRNGENEGFGRAVNRGAAALDDDTDVVIVTNNDMLFDEHFVERICEPFSDASVGMVAGVLTQLRAPDRIDTAGIELDVSMSSWDYLQDQPSSVLTDATPAPALACGGGAAYRMDLYRRLGGFDETLFAYWEDVDLGLRIRATGTQCAFAPFARAEHHHGATLGATSPFQRRLDAFGRGYLLAKWRMREASLLTRLRIAALDWPVLLVHLLVRREAAPIRERRRGIRAGRAIGAGAQVPLDLATISFREAVRRRIAFVRGRATGEIPEHFKT
jgi:GT2 family glycosyltransferase